MIRKIFLLWAFSVGSLVAYGQTIGVKTDVVSDALLFSPNLGVEVSVGPRLTLDLSAHYAPFSSGDTKRWKHWMIRPELRYWLCQPFGGHFFGVHVFGGEYNVANKKVLFGLYDIDDRRVEGWGVGAGLTYGYHWILSPRWGLEASIGLGGAYTKYDKYRCTHCGEKIGSDHKTYLGPTKASVSVIYMIK